MDTVPSGFEAAHEKWLLSGGTNFRNFHHHFGPDFYRTEYWKLVKEAVLDSKDFKCCRCGGKANQVHHLNYDHLGEDHFHSENLVAICRPCHGLIEYARNAELLISKIERRISLCNGFLEDRRGCLDQNAEHIYARLLEYRDQLANYRELFSTATFYANPRIKTKEEGENLLDKFRAQTKQYEEDAKKIVSTWTGTEKEKAARLLPMLELEIKKCREFIVGVFAPIS